MEDYLKFRKFITPQFIQIIFWIGVFFIVLCPIVALVSQGFGRFLVTLIGAAIGLVFWRVFTELMLLSFKIYDQLKEINQKTGTHGAAGPA